MKKNNKGFTLIELLAAMVILAFLFMIASYTIFNTIENSRNKLYISDAQKLIAKAEYKMNANSSIIDKPVNNNCLIFGLDYLGSGDFSAPPYDGEYLSDYSYVVVKKQNDNYVYYATLIQELKKGGYRGIIMASNSSLLSGSAKVDSYKIEDLSDVRIENDFNIGEEFVTQLSSGCGCSSDINDVKIYKEADLEDSSVHTLNATPKITKVTLSSRKNNVNTVTADLLLIAEDADSERKNLKVCTSFIDYSYALSSGCQDYGNDTTFQSVINMVDFEESYNYEEEKEVSLYVVVKDEFGAVDKKKLNYVVSKNSPPVINEENSGISKSSLSYLNDRNAILSLDVADDFDELENLKICLSEDGKKDCTLDDNFKPYSEYFDNGIHNHHFQKSVSGDGSMHTIAVTAMDSMGLKSPPVIFKFQFDLNEEANADISYNHITVSRLGNGNNINVKFTVLDQLELVNPSHKKLVKFYYGGILLERGKSFVLDGSINPATQGFDISLGNTFDGDYNLLEVVVYEENNESNKNNEFIIIQNYLNKAPNIDNTNILSTMSELCETASTSLACSSMNSLSAGVYFTISDDMTPTDNLKVLVTEDLNDCNLTSTSSDGYYSLGSTEFPLGPRGAEINGNVTYNYKFTFSNDGDEMPYDGRMKTAYLCAADEQGKKTYSTLSYQLYNNLPPSIDSLEIKPAENEKDGSLKVAITPRVFHGQSSRFGTIYRVDDVDSNAKIAYKLTVTTSDGETVLKEVTMDQINELLADEDVNAVYNYEDNLDKIINSDLLFDLSEYAFDYKGEEIEFKFELTDRMGATNVITGYYKVYENMPPQIEEFSVVDAVNACVNCDGGGLTLKVKLSVSDDIDNVSDLKLRLEGTESVDNYIISADLSYYGYVTLTDYNSLVTKDGYIYYTFPFNWNDLNYQGQKVYLNVLVIDSGSRVATSRIEYEVYKNKPPQLGENVAVTSRVTGGNSKDARLSLNVDDDFMKLFAKICFYPDDADESSAVCTDYIENNKFSTNMYNTSFDFQFPDDVDYNNQLYNVYAYVRDEFAEEKLSGTTTYRLSGENVPIINSVSAKRDEAGSTNGTVAFSVNDMFDTYSVCISKTNSLNCSDGTFTSTMYDGTSQKTYYIPYNNVSSGQTYYLIVKDSHNNKVKSSFSFSNYESCSDSLSENDEISYSYVGNRLDTENDGIVDINNNMRITQQRCMGQCYYWNPKFKEDDDGNVEKIMDESGNSNVFSYYVETVKKFDKFDLSNTCNTSDTKVVKVTCGHIDCFDNTNGENPGNENYQNNAIGIKKYYSTNYWTYTKSDGEVITYEPGSTYYKLYTTSYDSGDSYVRLTDTGQKIPTSEIGYYQYDSSSSNSYIRVNDDISYSEFISNEYPNVTVNSLKPNIISLGDYVVFGSNEFNISDDYDVFYVISSDNNYTTLLADKCLSNSGKQVMLNQAIQKVTFSSSPYWREEGFDERAENQYFNLPLQSNKFIYKSDSNISHVAGPIESYVNSLDKYGINILSSRLMTIGEYGLVSRSNSSFILDGCSDFWLASSKIQYNASSDLSGEVEQVDSVVNSELVSSLYSEQHGIRPVIVVPTYQLR